MRDTSRVMLRALLKLLVLRSQFGQDGWLTIHLWLEGCGFL